MKLIISFKYHFTDTILLLLGYSRDIIRNAVNASEHDSVIFVGNGATGAVHKLIHALDLKKPPVTSANAVTPTLLFCKLYTISQLTIN